MSRLLETNNNITFVDVKTTILYVLVSGSDDFYAEQLFVSITSLRRNSPGAAVSVLTDTLTHESLPSRGKMGARLLDAPDKWIVVPLDASLTKEHRSRILKTGMRQYVEGDFLFIDTDTLIVRPLDGIDAIPHELAFCLDHHCLLEDNPEFKCHRDECRQLGKDLSRNDFYFNSGVILSRDTAPVRAFFAQWQKNYLQGRSKGIKTDQQSLAQTLGSVSMPVGQLDGIWNCQLPYGVRYMGGAIVFHYFFTYAKEPHSYLFLLNDPSVLSRIRNSEELPSDVAAVIQDFFKGFPDVTLLIGKRDLDFRNTRRYKDLRRRYVPGKFSFLEFLLKVRARLPFSAKR